MNISSSTSNFAINSISSLGNKLTEQNINKSDLSLDNQIRQDSFKTDIKGKEPFQISFVDTQNSNVVGKLQNITYSGAIGLEVDEPEQPSATGILFNSDQTKDMNSANGEGKIPLGVGDNKTVRTYVYTDATKIKNPTGKGAKEMEVYQAVIVTNPSNEEITLDVKGSGYTNSKDMINKFSADEQKTINSDPIFKTNNKNPNYQNQNTRLADMKLSQDFIQGKYTLNSTGLKIPAGGSVVVYTKVGSSPEQSNIRSSYDIKVTSDIKDPKTKAKGLRFEVAVLSTEDMKKLSGDTKNTSGAFPISKTKYDSVDILKNQKLTNPINEKYQAGTKESVLKDGHPTGQITLPDGKEQFYLGRVNGIKSKTELNANVPDIKLEKDKAYTSSYKVNTTEEAVQVEASASVKTKNGDVPLNVNDKAYGNYHIKYKVETTINNDSGSNRNLSISLGTPDKETKSYSNPKKGDDKITDKHASSSYTGTFKITVDDKSYFVNATNNRIDDPDLLKNVVIPTGIHKVKVEFVIPTNSTGYQTLNFSSLPQK